MEAAIIVAVVSALANIIIATINGRYAMEQRKEKAALEEFREKEQRHEELRKKESQLSMRMINANTELTLCIALNMMRDVKMCDVDKAFDEAEEAKKAYEKFLLELGMEGIL